LTITGSFTANNKVYDGGVTATINTRSLTGVINPDAVSLTGGTATFGDALVAIGKTVTGTGFALGGTDAGNYTLASTTLTATANITPAPLTVTITANSKTYDGTATAVIATSSLIGVINPDVVTVSGGTATFSDKNVANGKTVTASGFVLGGANAGNYAIIPNSATTTANITARSLTVLATGINKTYDGNATATVTLSDDRVSGDTLTTGYASASFNNKSVGTGKPVAVTGITLTGPDAGNYTFNTTASTTASITTRLLTVSATGVNKVYDGTTTATVTLLDNRVPGDTLTASYTFASFIDPNVGTGKPVNVAGISISGVDAGNYTFNVSAITMADITSRPTTTLLTSSLFITVTPVRVDLVATVSSSGGPIPVGSVTFTDSIAGVLGTVSLSGTGTAAKSTASLGLGQHVITATYNPLSANFTGSQSASNTAPTATITGPSTGSVNPVGTPVTFTGTFSDVTGTTPTTAAWSFDTALSVAGLVTESAGSGNITKSQAFSSAGVYGVVLTVNDNVGGITMVNKIDGLDELVIVYDPNGGFVTGGGWILSPTGAYTVDPSATGKANFGFVSKYQKGATVPTGETEFQFQTVGMNFHSEVYQWLVISGAKAQYKGTGSINGQSGYGFLLTATDGSLNGGGGVDKFRIKIWRVSDSAIVYDNASGPDDIDTSNTQAIGGGSIVIHK
jgi:hypothetical protein